LAKSIKTVSLNSNIVKIIKEIKHVSKDIQFESEVVEHAVSHYARRFYKGNPAVRKALNKYMDD
jgi:hypothetical protein